MKIVLEELRVRTKRRIETVVFSQTVTFIHGPVSTGKSTVARLVDYCLGGSLERTPAVQQEFVAAELALRCGEYSLLLERGVDDTVSVRATWSGSESSPESASVPLEPRERPVFDDVFNLSDLLFKLAGIQPIRVRRNRFEPDAPLVRLSFRDLMWYCYLEQAHLDSSFFRMEDSFRRLKSRDVMRFVTGVHSERMSELDGQLMKAVDEQRANRTAVQQIRSFMKRFEFGSEAELLTQIASVQAELQGAVVRRDELERTRSNQTHDVEPLRERLRGLSATVGDARQAAADIARKIDEQDSLRAELITSKFKSLRLEQAGSLLQGASFEQCPQCGADVLERTDSTVGSCGLCGSPPGAGVRATPSELEALRRDLDERIDELADSLRRNRQEKSRQDREVARLVEEKRRLDEDLARELTRYDSAYESSIRATDREVARLQEREAQLHRLRELPEAITALETKAGEMQGAIDRLRSAQLEERSRLREADERVRRIADRFLTILLDVGFPGVYQGDRIELDTRTWLPHVVHEDQVWGFHDAGSGGKKTLFNVCYALAVHSIAAEEDRPLPSFLIIDSPTKNISQDENPALVGALYRQIYALAAQAGGRSLQFLLIDSDLVEPDLPLPQFRHQRMAGEEGAPCLISYYSGP